jgi:hypothetical protein
MTLLPQPGLVQPEVFQRQVVVLQARVPPLKPAPIEAQVLVPMPPSQSSPGLTVPSPQP